MNQAKMVFVLCCLISFFFGWLCYEDQLMHSSPLFWIFIPDCPLYVFFGFLVVVVGVKNEAFRFIASVGMVKYALWTLMIFAIYPYYYFSPLLFSDTVVLAIGHVLMVWAGLAILPKKVGWKMPALALGWFLLNDFVDYGLGMMPVFPPEHLGFVILFSFASTIALCPMLYYGMEKIRSSAPVAWLRNKLEVS